MFDLLQGVRVLEVTQLMNAAITSMLLADLGADVIKIEPPKRGDYMRDFLGQVRPHYSPAFMQMHKGKRGIALDLRKPQGREVFFRLLVDADLFVTNFIADVCDQLGIGYEAQRRVKPDIIFVQDTGFGATGPYAAIPTHGRHMNCLAGGQPLRMCEDGFVRHAYNVDLFGGTSQGAIGPTASGNYAALAAVAALQRRQRTGKGAYIDVGGADAVVASGWIGAVYNINQKRITDWTGISKKPPKDPFSESNGSSRYQFYQTQDKRFVLFAAIEAKFFRTFCRLVGREELAGKSEIPDFGLDNDKERHELQAIFHTRTLADWVQLAIDHDLPIGPANLIDEITSDPQLRHRGIFCEAVDPVAGPFTYIAYPANVDGHTYGSTNHVPALGEHTREVLKQSGYDAAQIDALQSAGIIG